MSNNKLWMEVGEGGDGPEAKRRKAFTKRETLQKLEELGNNVSLAVSEMVSDLSPFDVNAFLKFFVYGFLLNSQFFFPFTSCLVSAFN